jgi:hypothetical protein
MTMTASTLHFIYWKDPNQDLIVQVDISPLVLQGETITSVQPLAVNPKTTPPLTSTLTSDPTDPQVLLTLNGGVDQTTYGFQLQVTTSARVFLVQTAVSVYSNQEFAPYTTQNPQAFQDLVDQIEVGQAAIGTAIFAFPPQIDPRGGFVLYELLADDGTVYASGNSFSYQVVSNGLSNTVKAQCVIVAPSTMPPSLNDQHYQLRYTLELPQVQGLPTDPTTGQISQNTFYQFENIRVVGLNTVPLGVQPTVEIQGVPATLSLVTDKLWDFVTLELWANGQQLVAPVRLTDYQRTADGWYWAGVVDTSSLMVSLVPYSVIWKYWSSANQALVYQENTELYVTNASIMTAVNDVRAKINKSLTTLYGTPDLLYTNATVMTWLRRGADEFNGAYGQFTSFTMTNALGVVREYWLLCAEKAALQSQFLAEGMKAFNFQGAAISLDVDRTGYLETAIGNIQSQLDNELKPIKQNLIIKGNGSGDGSSGANANALQIGAIGAVGITITAANMWGRNYSISPWAGMGIGATPQ